jgi:hypothetical protein
MDERGNAKPFLVLSEIAAVEWQIRMAGSPNISLKTAFHST